MTQRKGKRGTREGTIRQRADGRWEGRVLLGYRKGKPYRPSFYGATRKAVQDKLHNALQKFKDGLPVQPDRQSVRTFMEGWLRDSAKARLRPRTFDGYEQHLTNHILPELGHILLQQLSPQDVQKMLKAATDAGLAPRTVRYIRAVLRAALNQALRWGLVIRNVATLVDVPRATKPNLAVLDEKQARTLVRELSKHRLGPLFSVGLTLGLRLGEALAVAWTDVDLKAGTLHVRRTLQRTKTGLAFGEPKSERSRRTVTLPDSLVAILRRHSVRQKKERLLAGGDWQNSGLVFTTPIGTALDDRNVRREFKAILADAKLPDIRIHDLRHTCATLLLVQGVHPRTVMETLGHSQISLTMDTYSHVLPTLTKDAAQKMDAILTGRKTAMN